MEINCNYLNETFPCIKQYDTEEIDIILSENKDLGKNLTSLLTGAGKIFSYCPVKFSLRSYKMSPENPSDVNRILVTLLIPKGRRKEYADTFESLYALYLPHDLICLRLTSLDIAP